MSVARSSGNNGFTHFHNFDGFFLHALRPCELWSFLRFTRAEEDLQALLHIVHEVFCGIGVIKQVFANHELNAGTVVRLGLDGSPCVR